MDQTKVILSIIRNNERSVLCLIAQKYERKNLFPQLTDQQFQVFKSFLKDQEALHDLVVRALKLLVRYIVTFYHKYGEAPLTEENAYCEYMLFLLDAVFKHGLKAKRTLTGYSKPYWSMISEFFYSASPQKNILGISLSKSFPEYFKDEKDTHRSTTKDETLTKSSLTPSSPYISAFEKISAKKTLVGSSASIAWFMLLLNYKDLHQKLTNLIVDSSIIRDWYEPYAFLNQEQAYMFCDLLTSLDSIDFYFQINEQDLDRFVANPDNFMPEKNLYSWLTDIIADVEAALEGSEGIPSMNDSVGSTEIVLSEEASTLPEQKPSLSVSDILQLSPKNSDTIQLVPDTIQDVRQSPQHCSSRSQSPINDMDDGALDSLRSCISQLESEVNSLKRANIQSLAEAGKYKALAQDNEIQYNRIKGENEKLKFQLQEEIAAHTDADTKFQELGSQLALVLNELSSTRSQTIKFQKTSASSQGMNHLLQEQLHESQKTTTRLEELLVAASEELALVKAEKENLERVVLEKDKLLETLANEMARSKLELNEIHLERRSDLSRQKFVSRVESKFVTNCTNCQIKFSVLVRKHHCRRDGKVYCDPCTTHRVNLPSHKKPERVCDACYADVIGAQDNVLCSDPNISN